ncbi:MAG: acetoacetate--CoA ligase [Burkholderiales bacterium]|nr:acetoacetate--CoA ligase [Burkholderiales bacterium]GIK88541.1 MAG: acetoacetyl-CoA synthetase [Betaproteobacteria bacterium]
MTTTKLWEPSPARIAGAQITAFARRVEGRHGVHLPDYDALWRWSIDQPEAFWRAVWEDGGVIGDPGERVLLDAARMPGARWFPDARLNYAQNLLERRGADDEGDALVFWGEDKVRRRMSHAELHRSVARVATALSTHGLRAGDRVAAYMPNLPETIVALLGAAARGCIFSSCSPDFGVQGVIDRFGQIAPRVLFTVDGYWYNGRPIAILDKVAEIVERLPSVERVVVVPYLGQEIGSANEFPPLRGGSTWEAFLAPFVPGPIEYEQLPFDHPLYILYSSGTTGVPKCIVHAAGGALLQHLKEHRLHGDVRPGDRLFYFTTCGWMMWNWLVSGLASQATLLLFDGSPFTMRGRVLWELAETERMTHFGTSAKYVDSLRKVALVPVKDYALEPLRAMFSTGSPLAPESFDYVYEAVKHDICLSSISGGTDIVSCFVLGNPTLPVWRGEIQCRGLGMAVEAYGDDGRPVAPGSGERGELVCTRPFPSMPIGFWNDPDGARYHAAYFERFPGVWCHGDYIEITARGGVIIYGRSDATLNPGGVRIGTAEIYRQVEQLDEVVESLVIGQDWPPGETGDVRVVLFVRLRDGLSLDAALVERIQKHIRANTTPRHVPAKVVQVGDIPRTKSGKIVELAVRDIVHGREVKNMEALANPEALEQFRDRDELKS